MKSSALLVDAFERIRDAVHPAISGLSPEELGFRPGGASNSIGWLVWHLARVQDDHVAALREAEQVWTAGGWAERFALPLAVTDIGYGHSPQEVGMVTTNASLLAGYFEEVHDATVTYIEGLSDADLDRVVDERWNPPVTCSVRLVSVVADDLQHVGQAAYVRGILPIR